MRKDIHAAWEYGPDMGEYELVQTEAVTTTTHPSCPTPITCPPDVRFEAFTWGMVIGVILIWLHNWFTRTLPREPKQ